MSEFEKMVDALKTSHTVEIRHKTTGGVGVANDTENGMAAVFYGADDGSDDKIITPEQFNAEFEITAIIST